MKLEVRIDMKNENALCTISMLSAMLEAQDGNYYGLITPFVLYSLPMKEGEEISVEKVTLELQKFGFVDFPLKLTEKILEQLCKKEIDKKIYIRQEKKIGKRKKFHTNADFDRSKFDDSQKNMREKIERILIAIQEYFKTHFYHKELPLDSIRDKLTEFFEVNGFTVIHSVNDLRMISKKNGSDAFPIAHFIIEEYEKRSIIYDDLCEVTKGFLTYKGLYYFLSDQKNQMNSKFRNVTFYLDCSLVLDVLNYDTTSYYNAITELIRLVRRCGGKVAVFNHTVDEAARLIETFANRPQSRNGFRLDNLAAQNLPRDILMAISRDIPETLKRKVQIDTVETPSFSDKSNYQNILGEQEIVDWLSKNRPINGYGSDADERYRFDAKSLLAVGMCRREHHPNYIENARAMIVTQDPWLNKCLKDLYRDKFRSEVYYAITDADLVSLLWVQDHKRAGNLPSDILIANAHAACRVSTEVMTRAIQIANTMQENGTIPPDAALLVGSHADFKSYLAERVHNDATRLSDEVIRASVNDYIRNKADEEISIAREKERNYAQEIINAQKQSYDVENKSKQAVIIEQEHKIEQLQKKIANQEKSILEAEERKIKKCKVAQKKAKRVAMMVHHILYALSILVAVGLVGIFAIHCYLSYIAEKSWLPYAIVDIVAFASIPFIFISKKSIGFRLFNRISDWVFAKVYSRLIDEE